MLTWTEPDRGKPSYFATLDRSDPAGIDAAIVEAWTKLLDGLDALAPASWSIIIAYLVVETGCFSLYPATREDLHNKIDDLWVSLNVHDWMMEYGDIHDESYAGIEPDDMETSPGPKAEARFERRYRALLKKMARALKEALADPTLAPRVAALKKRDRFTIFYVDQGEVVYAANLVYLWGHRPPKGFPAETPRMLFVGLLNKAGRHPDYSLKFDGDQVVEATFFGNDFNDKYVDILESVPDVATLCKRLRVLRLESTKIKPAGVERLKALFPKTKIKIKD